MILLAGIEAKEQLDCGSSYCSRTEGAHIRMTPSFDVLLWTPNGSSAGWVNGPPLWCPIKKDRIPWSVCQFPLHASQFCAGRPSVASGTRNGAGIADHVCGIEEIARLIPEPTAKKHGPYGQRRTKTLVEALVYL